MCTRTVLGRAQIVLWRTDDEEFHVTVWRSFFPYVREFLLEGRRRL
jgi:sarcosine oxidase subunit gamma